jgi:hypothetical protein
MNDRHDEGYQRLRKAVLETSGDAPLALRAAAAARTASLSGRAPEAPPVEPPLGDYIDKVALHAFKVLDRDLEELTAAGHSDDALFELTLAAALGAAAGRYERATAALESLQ